MRSSVLAVLAGMGFLAMAGEAHADKGDELGQCLISHSSPETETLMKDVLLLALQDQTETLNSKALQFSLQVIQIAQSECGLKMSDLEDPMFEKAAGLYGEFLGQKIIGDAFAKIGK